MAVKVLDAETTRRLLAGDTPITYVDVRTVAEFCQGHPHGPVINVPFEFFHPRTKARHENKRFLAVLAMYCSIADNVVLGGCDDDRAQRAAAELVSAGYERVHWSAGGLVAWQAAQLPVSRNNRCGMSYVSLLTATVRADAKR